MPVSPGRRLLAWAALDVVVMLACALGPWWTFLLMAPLVGGRIHALGVLLLGATTTWPAILSKHWWLPLAWAALFNACRFLAEHSLEPRTAGLEATTRELVAPWFTPFVFPHHVGLHRTHHRFPTAPWSSLPALAAQTGDAPELAST